MKILIGSDSHDNVPNLEKVLNWANTNNIEALIHAGDLSAPGVMKNTIAPNFKGQIYIINGNVCDKALLSEVCSTLPNVNYLGDEGVLSLASKKIFLTHYPDLAEKAFSKSEFNLVIHGHTHKAYIKKEHGGIIINPGTLGGLYNNATFAVYDSNSNSLEIIELSKI